MATDRSGPFRFELLHVDSSCGARRGRLHTPHGAWSKRLNYPGMPAAAQSRAVMAALDWLRRDLIRAARGTAVEA